MKVKNVNYDVEKSSEKIKEIFDMENDFEKLDHIPENEDKLTSENGYYVDAICVSVDLRGATELLDEKKKTTNSKILRAYISEVCAVMMNQTECKYITIQGDGIIALYDIDGNDSYTNANMVGYYARSVVDLLNKHLDKKDWDVNLKLGVGIDYGTLLMVRAGYKYSQANDIVWVGKAINNAVHISNKMQHDSGDVNNKIGASKRFYDKLQKEQQDFYSLTSKDIKIDDEKIYVKDTWSVLIDEFIEKNFK